MKNKIKNIIKILVVTAGCLMFASFSPSLDGRAVVVDKGVFPQGLFAKTVGYLPGDIISVTNIAGDTTIDLLVIGALDPSEGVAIMLSPEAAQAMGIDQGANNIVKITKRSGQDERVYGNAIISKSSAEIEDWDDSSFDNLNEENTDAFDDSNEAETEAEYEAEELEEAEEEGEAEEAAEESETPEEAETTEAPEESELDESLEETEEAFEEEAEVEEEAVESEAEEEAFEEEAPEEEFADEENIEEEAFEEELPEEESNVEGESEEVSEEAEAEEDNSEEYTDEAPEELEEPAVEEVLEDEALDELPEEAEDAAEESVAEEDFEEEFETEPAEELEEETEAAEEAEEDGAEEALDEGAETEEALDAEALEELPAEKKAPVPAEEESFENELPLEEAFVADELEALPEESNEIEEADEVVAESEEASEGEETEEYEAIVLVPADSNPPENTEDEVEDVVSEDELDAIDEAILLTPLPDETAKSISDTTAISVNESRLVEDIKDTKSVAGSYDKYMVPSLKDLESGKYYIQIAVYSADENILDVINKYGMNYPVTIVPMAGGKSKQILIGPVTMDEYKVVLERFKSYGFKDAFLRKIK